MDDVYDPLDEYANVFRDKFEQVAKDTFAQIAEEAQVDVKANEETCRHLYDTEKIHSKVDETHGWYIFYWVALWGIVAGGPLWALFKYHDLSVWALILIGVVVAGALWLQLTKVNPRRKELQEQLNNLQQTINQYRDEAWQQMWPLNRLFDWDILARMMSQTVPKLQFDPYFTTQRLADLQQVYGWDGSFNEGRSVLYSHSGLINGNPFVLCRTRKMVMSTKTYEGSLTIYWTTEEKGSDGKYHIESHSQTLRAELEAPYPKYYEKTRLIYGNTAAPDLTFYREQSGLANKEGSLSYKWKHHKLQKKAQDLKNGDFALMTNEDFEVAFDTSDRNNNHQYALLFTPLAQNTMLKLLKDKEIGFGDDFDFVKKKMINTIIPEHLQDMVIDFNPDQYSSFDYHKAESNFYEINARYFKAIYFALAPLLCVPMYQQIRSEKDIYGSDMPSHSSFWEHEALANFWGQDKFKHPQCVTKSILKTEETVQDNQSVITVYAHGYRCERRLSYISKKGNDGQWHDVPVYWDDYQPVVGQGSMLIQEDNDNEDANITQSQRVGHISDVLNKAGMRVYRKHIASKLRN